MQNCGNRPESDRKPRGRGRGRPRGFDRQAALVQAMRLFWRKGYEATSISDLTGALGISAPSLYAAFGSKESLYAESLRHYAATYDGLVWERFRTAATAREAVERLLLDSAAALTPCGEETPRGCMVVLSAVGSEGYEALGELARSARSVAFDRLRKRLKRAVDDGEIPADTDVHAMARYLHNVQSGMSVLSRDGARRAELEAVARMTLQGWDAMMGASSAVPPDRRSPRKRPPKSRTRA